MDNQISNEKLEKYFEVTNKAIQEVENKGFSEKNINSLKIAEDFLDMAKRYFSDAHHFNEKGDIVNAFAALNYAHGFLDAGARMGIFNVNNTKLFAAENE